MPGGYMGKVLWVDLSKGTLKDESLDEKLCRDYIGGYGFGARELYSRLKPGTNPLGPDNILGFMTGPCTGSPTITPSRYEVFCKSPLTNGWGDANSGGDFGPGLKFAGYDGVYFTGMSEKPVYLYIEEGKAELRDASALWGKDSFETEDALKAIHGEDTKLACIGQAGENLSLVAAVMNNKGRAAARSGVGAVMGSKKLKAIAVNGNAKVPVANPSAAAELRKKCLAEFKDHPWAMFFRSTGTCGIVADSGLNGDSPVKNWAGVGEVDFPNVTKISDNAIISKQERKYGCYRCPIACGGHMKAGTEYPYVAGSHKPEYETLAAFGTLCLNDNAESIIMTNDICNRYGLDTISVGSAIAFAIDCYENGIITKDDTDGLEMKWGNHQVIVAMTEKIAKRQGFGKILADGVKVAAETIGKGADKYAIHIGGQEPAMKDPRHGWHYATTYRMDATPARHTQGNTGYAPPGTFEPFDEKLFSGRGDAQYRAMSLMHIVNSTGMCLFVYLCFADISVMSDTLNAVTGWDTNLDELIKTGNRITTLRHAFNLREGLNPLELKIPGLLLGKPKLTAGPLAGIEIDEETLIKDYVAAEDWDPETAKPSKAKLNDLGLDNVAKDLYE